VNVPARRRWSRGHDRPRPALRRSPRRPRPDRLPDIAERHHHPRYLGHRRWQEASLQRQGDQVLLRKEQGLDTERGLIARAAGGSTSPPRPGRRRVRPLSLPMADQAWSRPPRGRRRRSARCQEPCRASLRGRGSWPHWPRQARVPDQPRDLPIRPVRRVVRARDRAERPRSRGPVHRAAR